MISKATITSINSGRRTHDQWRLVLGEDTNSDLILSQDDSLFTRIDHIVENAAARSDDPRGSHVDEDGILGLDVVRIHIDDNAANHFPLPSERKR